MEKQELQKKIPLVVIVGPTASGKSKLAVELAHWLQTEIVSADSMQIYRGMQIGTAKPDKLILRRVSVLFPKPLSCRRILLVFRKGYAVGNDVNLFLDAILFQQTPGIKAGRHDFRPLLVAQFDPPLKQRCKQV